MSKIVNPKVLVNKFLVYLDDEHNMKPKLISSITGLDYKQLRSIKNRGTGGTIEMVNTLLEKFPYLSEEFDLNTHDNETPSKKGVKELEEELEDLKKKYNKILENQNKILGRLLLLDDEDTEDN